LSGRQALSTLQSLFYTLEEIQLYMYRLLIPCYLAHKKLLNKNTAENNQHLVRSTDAKDVGAE